MFLFPYLREVPWVSCSVSHSLTSHGSPVPAASDAPHPDIAGGTSFPSVPGLLQGPGMEAVHGPAGVSFPPEAPAAAATSPCALSPGAAGKSGFLVSALTRTLVLLPRTSRATPLLPAQPTPLYFQNSARVTFSCSFLPSPSLGAPSSPAPSPCFHGTGAYFYHLVF